MAKSWKCAHCSAVNPGTTLTCGNCRRIQGSVVVPPAVVLPGSARTSTVRPHAPNQAAAPTSAWAANAAKPAPRRLKLAVVAFVGVLASGIVGLAIAGASPEAPVASAPDSEVVPGAPSREIPLGELRIGDCFDVGDDGPEPIDVVTVRSCADAHAFELFHTLSLPAGAYPGPDGIELDVHDRCESAFGRYVGTPWDEGTGLGFSWFYPSLSSWVAGDFEVQCFAFSYGEAPLTESVKGFEPDA